MTANIKDCYQIAVQLAKEAGEIIRNAIYQKKNVQTKICFVDLVTETDKQVEELLNKGFKTHFPDHQFIGEETVSDGGKCELTNVPTWIIDPVDGTMNFVHGFPYVAVSIGLAINKEIVLGVIYNPVLDKMFTAIKGEGSFCNGKKLSVSSAKELSQALVLTETGSNRDAEIIDQVCSNYRTLMIKAHGVRAMGSAALNMCEVASGHADAYFEYSIHCWDVAAGSLIVKEAGGIVIDPEGGPFDLMSRRIICASSLDIVNSLSKELKHIQMPRD